LQILWHTLHAYLKNHNSSASNSPTHMEVIPSNNP
jgi:hypothetical protein